MVDAVEIAPGVLVTTSRRYATTSTVVMSADGQALMVDPCWTPDELDGLAALLAARSVTVSAGWSTHAHHDHLLWHPAFGTVERWATPTAARLAAEHRGELAANLGPDFPAELADLVGVVAPLAQPAVPWPGPAAEIVQHDAHSPGHGAVWLPGSRVLLAGDMLSDIELPLPQDPPDPDRWGGDGHPGIQPLLAAYLDGLDRLSGYVGRASVLVPGHGRVTDRPMDRLDADRRYLDALLSGRPVDDPRLGLPDMAEAHRRNLELAGS
ncbi:MAG TPA: MBL fold metallo-hydrolase [Nakamurella sp.]|nr:MBL fold metallo-hydrolase [Nakamurella sp.]